MSRSTAAIQALLNRGVVLSQLRDTGNSNDSLTPLHATASSRGANAADVVKMLVGCGVDLEARTSDGETCTHVAAITRNEAALRCFINAGADLNSVNLDERTPLHLVSDYQCTVLLLAAGADMNKRDSVYRTAFQLAVSWGRTASLPAFIAAGADRCDVPKQHIAAVSDQQVDSARRCIAKVRLDFVRHRAMQVCIGLQSLDLDALQMCEILQHSCGPVAHVIAFHQWWKIATTVNHFR